MSGITGMHRSLGENTGRARIWKIMRRRLVFTLNDIVIPLDGVKVSNATKFIKSLTVHGIVRFDRWSGAEKSPGSCKVYRLISNTGPAPPSKCPACKQPVTAKQCIPGGES